MFSSLPQRQSRRPVSLLHGHLAPRERCDFGDGESSEIKTSSHRVFAWFAWNHMESILSKSLLFGSNICNICNMCPRTFLSSGLHFPLAFVGGTIAVGVPWNHQCKKTTCRVDKNHGLLSTCPALKILKDTSDITFDS